MNEGLKKILLDVLKSENLISEMNYNQIQGELNTQYATNQVSRHAHFTDLLKELGGFPQFQGVSIKKSNEGDLILIAEYNFNYTNSKDQDVEYTGTVEFKDFNQILSDLNEALKAKVDKLFSGELGLHCTCPSFYYRYNYVAGIKGSGIKQELRPAPITNPNDIGVGCKHVALMMNKQVFKFIYSDVFKSLKGMYDEAKKNALAKDPNLKKVVDGQDNNDSGIEVENDSDSDTELY